MRTRDIGFAVGLILALAVTGSAHWDPGDCHKMHYPQLPIDLVSPALNGMDVGPLIRLADDWQCSESDYVADIHFWISWQCDSIQPIGRFWVRIWPDNPVGPDGYSVPDTDTLLWERYFDPGEYVVRDMADHDQDWFNPWTGEHFGVDHTTWQQINIVNIEDPFYQEEGIIYWLEIDMCEALNAGWKVSGSEHFRDNAVYWDFPIFKELRDPITDESLDLAFVITGLEPSATEPSTWGRIKTLFK